MPFPFDTFVVVDMPAHVEDHVRRIRTAYGSARQFLPVEITVAGSSGVGVFDVTQEPDEALRAVERIARATAPFPLGFSQVTRFPESGVFYYQIADPAPLVTLHEQITTSGLRFKPNPFPFSPHLTIDTFDDATADLERELLALPLPAGPFPVMSLSVYSLHGWDCHRLHAFPLGQG